MEYFQDPETSLIEKVKRLEKEPDLLDVVIGEYEIYHIAVLEDVLKEVCLSQEVDKHFRYRVLEALYSNIDNKKDIELHVASYIPESSILEFQLVKWLFTINPHSEVHLPRLYKYLSNDHLDPMTRYSQAKTLEKEFPNQALKGVRFLFSQPVNSRCKILCGSYILEYASRNDEEKEDDTERIFLNSVFTSLMKVAEDEKEEYNTRADAADAVHHYSTGQTQKKALQILRELGGEARNLYENKQNVHAVDISEGLALIGNITPTTSFEEIAKLLTEDGDADVAVSLGRIAVDPCRYGKDTLYNSEQILERVYEYIQTHPEKEQLYRRLTEELKDMANTCSSGHALRVMNVLSGYGADVRISFQDQITGNFIGRINARIRKVANEDLQNEILTDITSLGPAYLKFITQNMGEVIGELEDEFVPMYISEDEFQEYMKKTLDSYTSTSVRPGKVDFKQVEESKN